MSDAPIAMRTLLQPSEWLAGHRAALAILVDIDPSPDDPVLAPEHDMAGAGYLSELLQDFDVTPTVIARANVAYVIDTPSDAPIDTAVHVDDQSSDTASAIAIATDRFGTAPAGLVHSESIPASSMPEESTWIAEARPAPFPLRNAFGTVVIPTNRLWNDRTWLNGTPPAPPSAMLESWSLSLQSVRTHQSLMTVVLSSRMAGHPGTVETIRRFLDEAVGAGDVWITNATSVARHVADLGPQE